MNTKTVIVLCFIALLSGCAGIHQLQPNPKPEKVQVAEATKVQTVSAPVSLEALPTFHDKRSDCIATWEKGKASGQAIPYYFPTTRSKDFHTKKLVDAEERALESDACIQMVTVERVKWVIIKEGTKVFIRKKDLRVVALSECRNTIFETVPLSLPAKALVKDCPTCVPGPRFVPVKKEASNFCSIGVLQKDSKGNTRLIARLYLYVGEQKEGPRFVRIAKHVVENGVESPTPEKRGLSDIVYTGNCDKDQQEVSRNWSKVITTFGLPDNCEKPVGKWSNR